MAQELARQIAAGIFSNFEDYNRAFRAVTSRAAQRFVAQEWLLGQVDASERIALYDQRVEQCVADLVGPLGPEIGTLGMWREIRTEFASLIVNCPDRKFDATFFNSVTRKVFQTVGVNREVEFSSADEEGESPAPHGAEELPMLVAGPGLDLLAAVSRLLTLVSWAMSESDRASSASFIAEEIRAVARAHAHGTPVLHLEALQPVFYRATRAFLVGKVVGDGWTLPLIVAFAHTKNAIQVDAVMMSEYEVRPLFGFSRSYFHADLPAVEPAIRYLQEIMPGKPVDEIYTVLGRAKQGKTERYRSLFRHLAMSSDAFVHTEGIKGMVMIVFTLYSTELVFKVIRDRFAEPKTASREEVMQKYQFVFQHDRVGRLVDAQEFRQLRFPKARFGPALLTEILTAAADTARIEGDDLILGHCYMERRMKPLDVFLREASPDAALRAIRDYGQAIRDLALSNVFPGDLLLKNFGVSRHGRVVFYDYDELCLVTECFFRDLPVPRDEEDEMRAEPWFFVGATDVFPEQFLEFLGLRGGLLAEFLRYHQELLTADYWRRLKISHLEGQHLEVVPYTRKRPANRGMQ